MSLRIDKQDGQWEFQINGHAFNELAKASCKPPTHILSETFECQFENCNMKPILCRNCAFKSANITSGVGSLICKLCRVTERMDVFDPTTFVVEDAVG